MTRIIDDAVRKSCNCVIFVVDQETHDPSKRVLLERITSAFEDLCTNLPEGITVGLVVAHSCLECWLLADAPAIARFQAGKRGVRYDPAQSGQTERYNPIEASQAITNIMRQVARAGGMRDTKRIKYEKSHSAEIVQKMEDFSAAAKRNQSLMYFFEMVLCDKDGCTHIQPQLE